MTEKVIQRQSYLDQLKGWNKKQIIKVISGVRRCGKSTLFRLYIDWLLSEGVKPEQIIFINLEELEYENLLNYHVLHDYIIDRLYAGDYTYVFIDEVQRCQNFEKSIASLFVKKNIDLYITGSNAYLLSGELATLLAGRYVQIQMLPLSFAEYVSFTKNSTRNRANDFQDYIRYGAFPAIAALHNEDKLIGSYLDGVYDSILIKDVSTRLGILDISILEGITKFLFSSIGSAISVKKIADTINSAGRNISVNTVSKYLQALLDSYLFYKTGRYDIRRHQLLKTQSKYYAVDNGLRTRKLSTSSSDIGHVLENVVFLELIRRGNKVNIGKMEEKEVDFIAENSSGIAYYQVSATTLDEEVLKRELYPLRKISDNHSKYLLTLDELFGTANYDGIQKMNVLDWLLGKKNLLH